MQTLTSDRLCLRAWTAADAAGLYAFASDESMAMAGAKPHESIEESRACLQGFIESGEVWAIALRTDDTPIGWIGLHGGSRHGRYRELEYAVAPGCRGQGYATEAVRRVLAHAFDDLALLVVAVCHYPENAASRRVIEKCGFTYEGTLRRYSKNRKDSVRYSMLREEWAARRP